jgi:hypothetical protein
MRPGPMRPGLTRPGPQGPGPTEDDPRDEDPRDEEPSPPGDVSDASPTSERTDPVQTAISLLESGLGARRIEPDA